MEQITGWQGPEITGFYYGFADPEVERRFLVACLDRNRGRLLTAIAIAASIAGAGVFAQQLGYFTAQPGFSLAPALLQLSLCAVFGLAVWGARRLPVLEGLAAGFGASFMLVRCWALYSQSAFSESAGATITATIGLLYVGLPLRLVALLPMMVAGSAAMFAAWVWHDPAPGSAAVSQMLLWVVVANGVALTTIRMIRLSARREWAQAEALQRLALYDDLTGLANRHAFETALRRDWLRCQSLGTPLSLVTLDVDFFKLLNDSLGHAGGDEVLRKIATLVAGCVSQPDQVVARIAGQEFAVLLPEINETAAAGVAEVLVNALRDAAMEHPCSPLGPHVTVSVAVATGRPGHGYTANELTALAERLIYAAKRAGRNRVRQQSLGIDLGEGVPPAPHGRLDAAGRGIAGGW